MSKNKYSFFERLKSKYVFSIRPENDFIESAKSNLTILEVISLLFVFQLLLFSLFFAAFKYTSLKTLLGVDSNAQKQRYLLLEQRTDSLELVVKQNDFYITTINKLIRGENVDLTKQILLNEDEIRNVEISEPTQRELTLRDSIIKEEMYTLVNENTNVVDFLPPVEGNISNTFDPSDEHFGIDITAEKNSPVLAVADGVVLYSSWNAKDGHTIILSHNTNYISLYKHNKKALKNIGDRVVQGEAIGIIGNTGDNTTGEHLHFELWQNGFAKDPLNYFKLK